MQEVKSNKICFIACVNNDMYWEECQLYLRQLIIPEGYEVDIISIREAKSMTAGYNEGMKATDAKYKIYLHQDTFLVNPYFLMEMLDIFQSDASIGMMGMVGAPKMAEDGIMWNSDRVFCIYCAFNKDISKCSKRAVGIEHTLQDVEAVDGLLMATQVDLPWREDVFDGWDFYDSSQSAEFLRTGYRVVVPYIQKPMCVHDDGHILSLDQYDTYRIKYLEHY